MSVAALTVYLVIMVIEMYDGWTPVQRLLYPVSGVIVVVGFCLVFVKVFQLLLPEPR